MSAGWLGHFPETEDPDLQLQVQVPPELEQADSWMTPLPENEQNVWEGKPNLSYPNLT